MATRVLIVDDIFSNRLLISSTFETIGVETKSVINGQEAIDSLMDEKFDLVLMDIEMPVMNGLETVKYIRKKGLPSFCQIPVIALTAHNPLEYGDDIENAGFNEILTKPYSVKKLQELLFKYIESSQI